MVEFGLVKGNRAANSTLLPPAFLSSTGQSSGSAPAHTAVRLPKQSLEAWRYTGLRPVGVARELTVYTVPTSAGVATVACAVPASQAASLAAQCDAIAGTLQLKKATAYPVGASDTYATALNGTIGELQQTSRSQETTLQNAQTLAGQAAAANALASAYDAAAAQLAALQLSPADRQANGALVTALRAAAAAYRKAARAATAGDADAYRAASAAVPGATTQVNSALAGVAAAGYKSVAPSGSSGNAPRAAVRAPPAAIRAPRAAIRAPQTRRRRATSATRGPTTRATTQLTPDRDRSGGRASVERPEHLGLFRIAQLLRPDRLEEQRPWTLRLGCVAKERGLGGTCGVRIDAGRVSLATVPHHGGSGRLCPLAGALVEPATAGELLARSTTP